MGNGGVGRDGEESCGTWLEGKRGNWGRGVLWYLVSRVKGVMEGEGNCCARLYGFRGKIRGWGGYCEGYYGTWLEGEGGRELLYQAIVVREVMGGLL